MVRGVSTIGDVTKSIECLIENIQIDRIPLKLFCSYRSALDGLEDTKRRIAASGVRLPIAKPFDRVEVQAIAKQYVPPEPLDEPAPMTVHEGDPVPYPGDLPQLRVRPTDANEQRELESEVTEVVYSDVDADTPGGTTSEEEKAVTTMPDQTKMSQDK